MKQLSFDIIKNSVITKGYKWFTDKPMIIGIRTTNDIPNVFNDYIILCIENKDKFFKGWMATTEPGTYWLQNPMNIKGTGVLVPNQYFDCWGLGQHGSGLNKHEALIQIRPITLYRDNNKDNKINIDPKNIQTGLFGINIHSTGKSNWIASKIDKWSAGCQVFANYDAFKEFIKILKATNQKSYTYTLLEEKDIV